MNKSDNQYMNRDLSWLSFNKRVLDEAADHRLPLYERLKFLAIYSSNLDEFYKVRVASYKRAMKHTGARSGDQSSEPARVLTDILKVVDSQQNEFGRLFWKELVPGLKKNNITLIRNSRLPQIYREYIRRYFYEEVIPYLQPQLILKKKVSPFLQDGAIYLAIKLLEKTTNPDTGTRSKVRYALVNIPSDQVPRFLQLPSRKDQHAIIFLDDIIKMNLETLFPGFVIDSAYSIKISRDADLEIEDEFTGDLVEKISSSLSKRKTGIPSRFLYDSRIPDTFLKLLKDTLNLKQEDLVPGGRYHNFSDLFAFPNPVSPRLESKTLPVLSRKELDQYDSMFEAIEDKDWMLHFPYHSYEPVIRFLNEAAIDPKVKEIKTTQYRVASDSAIVNALINARNNGKKVTVFVEVKARFDEQANLLFAKIMKKAGIKIIYSLPGLKVHAKVALVSRTTIKGKKKAYAFLSTGNFNEKTAKIYADHGLFTSHKEITSELKDLFSFLEDQNRKIHPKHLLIARFNLKKELSKKINREINFAKQGKPAWMILKMNGIDHTKMMGRLYEASRHGVKIDLIVRGICSIIPRQDYSSNITVTRIIDRYLEHARVFIFGNGDAPEIFMASADWMNRNLERRIELCFPIYNELIKKEVMDIIDLQLRDNTKARHLDPAHNHLMVQAPGQEKIRAQLETHKLLKE